MNVVFQNAMGKNNNLFKFSFFYVAFESGLKKPKKIIFQEIAFLGWPVYLVLSENLAALEKSGGILQKCQKLWKRLVKFQLCGMNFKNFFKTLLTVLSQTSFSYFCLAFIL